MLNLTHSEPTDLELAIIDRWNAIGFGQVGPLTESQQATEDAYEAYMEEQEREAELERIHGAVRCPSCDQFTMKLRVVSTGYDQSTLGECSCGHVEFAG